MVSRPAAGILHPPGKGKTSITYFAYKTLKDKKMVKRMLIIAKRRIIYNSWTKENQKWEGLGYSIAYMHGKTFLEALLGDAEVTLMTYEGLAKLKQLCKLHKIDLSKRFDMAVLDESTKIKAWNKKSKRKYLIQWLAPQIKRRYILTGTPTPRTLLDIYGQVWFCDGGKTLGSKSKFQNDYFLPCGFKGKSWEPWEGAEEKVFKKLKNILIRYEALDYNPEKVDIIRWVTLPPDARKVYDEMESDFISYIDGNPIVSVNGAVASGKCRQIANGGLYTDIKRPGVKNREWAKIHDEKTEELIDLVEELNGMPALVAYEYQHDLKRLQEAFPKAPYIGAGVSDKKADEIIDQWNAGKIPLLFGHPDSIAHGLNLQGVESAVIYYSLTWNLENFEQFYQRIIRRGQTASHIFVYYIMAENTVDEIVAAAIERKDFKQKAFTTAVSDYYLDKIARKYNMSKLSYKERFEFMSEGFINNSTKLPPYCPGMEQEFIKSFLGIFASWSISKHQEFHECMHEQAVFHKQPVSMFCDASRNIILSIFDAKYDVVSGGFIIKSKSAFKSYPNIKTKAEIKKMGFKKKDESIDTRKSKFSKEGAKAKASDSLPGKKDKPAKKVAAKKPVEKKVAAKKEKVVKEKPAKKAAAKKPAAKKVVEKKVAAKKPAAKKEKVVKEKPAKKAPAKKAVTEKPASKKAAASFSVAKGNDPARGILGDIYSLTPGKKGGTKIDKLVEIVSEKLDHKNAGDPSWCKYYINLAIRKGHLVKVD